MKKYNILHHMISSLLVCIIIVSLELQSNCIDIVRLLCFQAETSTKKGKKRFNYYWDATVYKQVIKHVMFTSYVLYSYVAYVASYSYAVSLP